MADIHALLTAAAAARDQQVAAERQQTECAQRAREAAGAREQAVTRNTAQWDLEVWKGAFERNMRSLVLGEVVTFTFKETHGSLEWTRRAKQAGTPWVNLDKIGSRFSPAHDRYAAMITELLDAPFKVVHSTQKGKHLHRDWIENVVAGDEEYIGSYSISITV